MNRNQKSIDHRNMADMTAMGKFMQMMERVMAEGFHEHKSDVIKRAMLEKASTGYLMGKPPLGYTPTQCKGLYAPNSVGKCLKVIFAELAQGNIKPRASQSILAVIYEAQVGRKISNAGVIKWVSNPYYAGFISYKGSLHQGLHKPLMTPEQQDKLVKRLKAVR